MLAAPEASPIAGLSPPPVERRAAIGLAGVNIACAAWLLVCTGVGLARGAATGVDTALVDARFWSGWAGPLRAPIEFTLTAGFLFLLVLLPTSLLALATDSVRATPRIFRLLAAGTVTLALAFAAMWTLEAFGLVSWGLLLD
jgi:hypothetical protein